MKKYITKKINATSYVKSIPIEYKSVDVDDFISCGYTSERIMIEMDDRGYVDQNLLAVIDINKKSTDVLNITTGCGKTTAIYQLISKINKEVSKAIIIVATPYLSLVEKDYITLINEYNISKDLITDYRELKKDLEKETASSGAFLGDYIQGKKIHITTINALLRNPGDTAFAQKTIKTNYFSSLFQYCIKNDLKLYLFLDEVHASIHNFRNEYIYFLTMWKDVMQKCIISTATYTEPVSIVIKHMAYMTNDKINIYETVRNKKTELSPLDIAFFPYSYPKDRITDLSHFLNDYIMKNIPDHNNQNFHIISYSRKIAESLNKTLFKHEEFILKYLDTLLLTSSTDYKYTEGRNHIGTNFSTGVDIKNKDNLLIILFPFKYSDESIKGEEGIFYDGLPSILQAVARLRSQGRILFVIPPMKAYIKDDMAAKLFSEIYPYKKNLESDDENQLREVEEDFLKDEKKILESFIKKRNKAVEKEQKKYIENIEFEKKEGKMKRPEIQFPSNDTFILERGQEFLKYRSYKSGKFITPYVIWAALKDQYINCTLTDIYYFIRRTEVIKIDCIPQHLLNNGIKLNHYKDFSMYYSLAKKALTEYEKDGEIIKVKITENEKTLNPNTITVFWRIVGSYNIDKTRKPIISMDDYYQFCINNRKDEIGTSYQQVKLITTRIYNHLKGKIIFEKDALTDDKVTQYEGELQYLITTIKEADPVIKALLSEKNAFWNTRSTTNYPLTRYLLQNCLYRESRKKDGSCSYNLKEVWM